MVCVSCSYVDPLLSYACFVASGQLYGIATVVQSPQRAAKSAELVLTKKSRSLARLTVYYVQS